MKEGEFSLLELMVELSGLGDEIFPHRGASLKAIKKEPVNLSHKLQVSIGNS